MQNATIEHINGDPLRGRVTRRVYDDTADMQSRRLAASNKKHYASTARVNTAAETRIPNGGDYRDKPTYHSIWAFNHPTNQNKSLAGGSILGMNEQDVPQSLSDAYQRQTLRNARHLKFDGMLAIGGVKPKTNKQFEEMYGQLDPAQQVALEDHVNRQHAALNDQKRAVREPARPFDDYAADKQSGFERRNPGSDKHIDPVGNSRQRERLLLERSDSARFLPAELLHMIRPDKQSHKPLSDHPGYNSAPSRTIRDRIQQAAPANYVHH
jgi:hypothetical protein